jgi:uncharacterized protein YsxB (DUF464 family)
VIQVRARVASGLTSIEVTGHETNSAAGGRVCAAVTAITSTALLGLMQIAELNPDLVSVETTEE